MKEFSGGKGRKYFFLRHIIIGKFEAYILLSFGLVLSRTPF